MCLESQSTPTRETACERATGLIVSCETVGQLRTVTYIDHAVLLDAAGLQQLDREGDKVRTHQGREAANKQGQHSGSCSDADDDSLMGLLTLSPARNPKGTETSTDLGVLDTPAQCCATNGQPDHADWVITRWKRGESSAVRRGLRP